MTRLVPCPKCGATIGQPCFSKRFSRYLVNDHREREKTGPLVRKAAHQARNRSHQPHSRLKGKR